MRQFDRKSPAFVSKMCDFNFMMNGEESDMREQIKKGNGDCILVGQH
jgi:hypothetical protein